jgi:hypothetical protein
LFSFAIGNRNQSRLRSSQGREFTDLAESCQNHFRSSAGNELLPESAGFKFPRNRVKQNQKKLKNPVHSMVGLGLWFEDFKL